MLSTRLTVSKLVRLFKSVLTWETTGTAEAHSPTVSVLEVMFLKLCGLMDT